MTDKKTMIMIIKGLIEEFEKQLTCLRENADKYRNFKVSIEKGGTRIDKNVINITIYFFLSWWIM